MTGTINSALMNEDVAADGHFTVMDRDGKAHRLPGLDGFRLMEIMRDFGLPIAATCGGAASCGTCHVYVADSDLARLHPMRDDEAMELDRMISSRPNSRLSCQIIWDRDRLDGLKVALAPTA